MEFKSDVECAKDLLMDHVGIGNVGGHRLMKANLECTVILCIDCRLNIAMSGDTSESNRLLEGYAYGKALYEDCSGERTYDVTEGTGVNTININLHTESLVKEIDGNITVQY